MKRKLYFGFLLLALCVFFVVPVQASAKSNALKAYKAFLEKQPSYSEFAIIYLDNNSVPELVFTNKIYTYKKGSMVALKYNYYKPYSYFKKKKVVMGAFGHGNIHMSYITNEYFVLSGTELNCQLYMDGYADKNTKMTYSYHVNTGKNGKIQFETTTKPKFTKKLKSYVGSKKETKIKYYKNTAANRKKRLK